MKKMIVMTATILSAAVAFSQTDNKDEEAIRSIVTTLETAWNNKSGDSFSSVFAEKHDYIVVNGMYFPQMTKKGNAAAHQALFDGIYKKRDIKLKVDKVFNIRPDLAMLYVLGAAYEKGGMVPKDPGVIMSILVEKQKDGWKIIVFHNHNINTEEVAQSSPMPLNVMYASWYKQ